MSCPNCALDLPIQCGACPRCGVIVGPTATGQSAPEKHFWVLALIGATMLLGCTYFFIRAGVFRGLTYGGPPTYGSREFPVVHGAVATPQELQGHGKLYFVPIGKQVIPVETLADYYRRKFSIDITVLAEAAIKPSSCIPSRQQCVAENLLDDVGDIYPKLVADPDTVVIALTDEDLFPRGLGWNFTYSYNGGNRVGIVSTRRMDPTFWGEQPNPELRLANTKQMLTKYIALLYFRLPTNHDPTSVMHQPLTPNGGADDLYESDLHPEESAAGFGGSGWACLSFHYSYRAKRLEPTLPLISECYDDQARSPDEEIVQVELNTGQFTDHTMEFGLNSIPRIELRRGYRSDARRQLALGFGTDHNYNSWVAADASGDMKIMYINRLDTNSTYIERLSPGRGFSPAFVFQSRAADGELFGPRLTWETDHFKVVYSDGSWSTFLPCKGRPDCYWIGYQDARKNSLVFDRDSKRNLLHLIASNGQGIEFTIDTQQHVTAAKGSNGQQIALPL